MAKQCKFVRFRFGMTLVELLMVITIMTILLAVAVPMLRPAFRDRQLREGSRQVNAFFAGAKSRAAETGRSVGVWIERRRSEDNSLYSTQLYLAEVSPSFTGSVVGTRATVEYPTAISPPIPPSSPEWPLEFDYTNLGELYFWDAKGINFDLSTSALLRNLVANYEVFFIRFDHKGSYYSCMRYDVGATAHFLISLTFGEIPRGTEHVPPPATFAGLTFEITRGPSKSIVSPQTLSGDAILDLTVSGVGLGQHAHAFDFQVPQPNPLPPPAPVIIMFTPAGQVGFVYVDNIARLPNGSIYLLVGRRAKIANGATLGDPELSNLADPANLWLTINNRTGAITTDDNAATDFMPASVSVRERIKAAREFARGSRQKGGR